jgi:uncharacterized protein
MISSIIAAPFLVGGYGWASAHTFGVSKHTFKMPQLEKPLKLVQLTDLHFGRFMFETEVRNWVNATNLEKPDLIVITGDIVDRVISSAALDSVAFELSKLSALLGVYATLGNHDYWYVSQDQSVHGLVKRLEKHGIRVLVNDGVKVRDDFFLAGIDDLWNGEPNLERTLRDQPKNGGKLLLSHNPDILVRVPANIDLTLSGHTHGGQVRIPGLPTLFNVSNYGERFQQGFVRGSAPGFVSRGLGVGALPLRFNCPAELVVLELLPML